MNYNFILYIFFLLFLSLKLVACEECIKELEDQTPYQEENQESIKKKLFHAIEGLDWNINYCKKNIGYVDNNFDNFRYGYWLGQKDAYILFIELLDQPTLVPEIRP